MNHILKLIARVFPPDKALHFLLGAIAASIGAALSVFLTQDAQMVAGAVASAFCVGAVKEAADAHANAAARDTGRSPPHEVSSADLWYTTAGSVPVALPLLVVRWLS